MTTKLIGVREFRQNMATLYAKAKKNNLRYIVLNHNQPIFKVEPLSKKDAIIERLAIDVEEAREDVRQGRVYDFEEVCKEFGL
jgi:antitoxin (DNA-binding transcriptional repressor) of toxin-antitoxin stability system